MKCPNCGDDMITSGLSDFDHELICVQCGCAVSAPVLREDEYSIYPDIDSEIQAYEERRYKTAS